MHMPKTNFIYIHTYTFGSLFKCHIFREIYLNYPSLNYHPSLFVTFYPCSLALFFFMTLITICISWNMYFFVCISYYSVTPRESLLFLFCFGHCYTYSRSRTSWTEMCLGNMHWKNEHLIVIYFVWGTVLVVLCTATCVLIQSSE